MNKYFIGFVLLLVLAITVFFGVPVISEMNNETKLSILTWFTAGISVLIAAIFAKQVSSVAITLAKSLLAVAPDSTSKILQAAIYILEFNSSVIEKMLIKHAIKLVMMRKDLMGADKKKTVKRKGATETVTQLYLVKSKVENLRAKFIAVIGLLVLAIASFFLSQSLLICLVPITFFFILELKIRILEFRVDNGFFGTNRLEVLQLLQFITDKKNKDDFDGRNGKRKVFVELLKAEDNKVFNSENGVFQ